MKSDGELRTELEELHKNLGRKHKFEEAVSSLRSLLRDSYLSASPPIQKLFYSVVCRVATVLKTRYTAPGFWLAGLGLFEEAEKLASEASEKEVLRNCVDESKEYLRGLDNPLPDLDASSSSTRGYLFEGHLTVDPEPPQPLWLLQQNHENLLRTAAAATSREQEESRIDPESIPHLLEELANNFDEHINRDHVPQVLEELVNNFDSILSQIMDHPRFPKAPPASKEVVAKLPVTTVTQETLVKIGCNAECAICKETLVIDDQMQELPCKHIFHPPCLKPWLDEHNSCPICRNELPTDDHAYESWKERQKEAEEERKGAANALRGGEYMYV